MRHGGKHNSTGRAWVRVNEPVTGDTSGMASVLLSSLAGMGAADHAVSIAVRLRERGHRVSVVTSEAAAEPYLRAGFSVHVVPEPPMPELNESLPPLVRRAWQLFTRVQRNVIDPLPAQWPVVRQVIDDAAVDVVVTDPLFLGGSMLAARPRASRPAVIMVGFSAPWTPDPNTAPYGMGLSPGEYGANRVRAAAYELIAARALGHLSRSFNQQVEKVFGVQRRGDLRSSPSHADIWAQLTVPRFEYPRAALPQNFRFIGPLHPPADDPLPTWWSPAAASPVVAIRAESGAALKNLVVPALHAFGDSATSVIVAGVSRASTAHAYNAPLPANVHFEDRLPWSWLGPKQTVVISDGDYTQVQHALRQGVPLVLAGTLETDVETAARVAWSGAGIDLRTSRPTQEVIAAAVERIRADDAFRSAAARIAAQIAATDAEATIADLVDEVVGARQPGGSP